MPTKEEEKSSTHLLWIIVIIGLIAIGILTYFLYKNQQIQALMLLEIANMGERTGEGVRTIMGTTCKMFAEIKSK